MTNGANNLGIDYDDAIDIIIDIEARFGVAFSDEEAEKISNFGNLYNAVVQKLPLRDTMKCHSQMAFYVLRGALRKQLPEYDFTTSSPLVSICDQCTKFDHPKQLYRHLIEESGLQLPPLSFSAKGKIAVVLLLLGIPIILAMLWLGHQHVWPGLMIFPFISYLLFNADPGCFTQETLGDLAREVASLNYGQFVARGGRHNELTLWKALCELMTAYSDFQTVNVNHETTFFVSQRS